VLELRQLGGALGRTPAGAGALAKLDGGFAIFASGVPGDVDALHERLGELRDALAPWTVSQPLLNPCEGAIDPAPAFGADAWRELRRVRAAFDPDGRFVARHPVPMLGEDHHGLRPRPAVLPHRRARARAAAVRRVPLGPRGPERRRRTADPPDGRMDLVWTRELGGYVSGPRSRFRTCAASRRTYGARFRPGAAPSPLRVPASELLDARGPLAAVGLGTRLDSRLEDACDDRRRSRR
jgi:hypothetical protein